MIHIAWRNRIQCCITKESIRAEGLPLQLVTSLPALLSPTLLTSLEGRSVTLCGTSPRQRLLLAPVLSSCLYFNQLLLLVLISQADELAATCSSHDQILLRLRAVYIAKIDICQ